MESRSRFQAFLDAVRQMPGGAIVVVTIGLVATFLVALVSLFGDGSTATVPWVTSEPIPSAGPKVLGPSGSVALGRGQISTTAQTTRGDFIYRVSGQVRLQSPGVKLLTVRCQVESRSPGSQVVRTLRKRASWPRPSDDLAKQIVPEIASLRFQIKGSEYADVSLRDAINNYTDSGRPTLVEWPDYDEDRESWVWRLLEGSGPGTASLGYIVIFKTNSQPEGIISCAAESGATVTRVTTSFRQREWPLPSITLDPADSSQQSDVE